LDHPNEEVLESQPGSAPPQVVTQLIGTKDHSEVYFPRAVRVNKKIHQNLSRFENNARLSLPLFSGNLLPCALEL
jgi:hypothetical protein